MKVLYLTHAVFLDPDRISTGNSVRAYYLSRGVAERGHQVIFAFPVELQRFGSPGSAVLPPGVSLHPFSGPKELAQLLERVAPDVVLVGYWELLEQLPPDPGIPVVLDAVAPRVLEAIFQPERDLADEVRRMVTLYRRADHFLVGTERQRHFMLPWLILAGFDCRFRVPVDVLPISTEPSREPGGREPGRPLRRLVSGGVEWPWRRTERWFAPIAGALRALPSRPARLTLFSGQYLYASDTDGRADPAAFASGSGDVVERHGLLAYAEMQRYLEQECDVGIELADRNVEREYSQSFRAMEFLRAGLPLILNDYLEIADAVRAYDAGWLVASPDELPALIAAIADRPEEIARKSANALRLVRERYHYTHTVGPLADFVVRPVRAEQTAIAWPGSHPASLPPSVVAAPPSRLRRAAGRAKAIIVRVVRGIARRMRSDSGEVPGVVMVSRSDIFPPNHGAAVKIDRTAAAMSLQGREVYLVTDERRGYHVYRDGERSAAVFPFWVRWLAPPLRWVRRRALQRGIPRDDAFLYYPLFDWSFAVRAAYIGMRRPVALYQAEFPAYARACIWGRSLFGGRVLLVEHNVEYQRLRDQYEDLAPDAHAFLRGVEVQLCRQSDAVITVSERDRERLIGDGVPETQVHYIPHGVDLRAFDAAVPAEMRPRWGIADDETVLVYHGTYLYPPNLEAMEVMANEILPRLEARGVKVRVLALGAHPPSRRLHERIVFTGPVEHVAPYLLAADIAVVPLLRGGGTRMKILDYFAASLPVVTTSKGIEGIPVSGGVHACITDGVDDAFVAAIEDLVQHPDTAAAMGRAGRQYVETLDWTSIARRYLEVVDLSGKAGSSGRGP